MDRDGEVMVSGGEALELDERVLGSRLQLLLCLPCKFIPNSLITRINVKRLHRGRRTYRSTRVYQRELKRLSKRTLGVGSEVPLGEVFLTRQDEAQNGSMITRMRDGALRFWKKQIVRMFNRNNTKTM